MSFYTYLVKQINRLANSPTSGTESTHKDKAIKLKLEYNITHALQLVTTQD